VFTPAARSGSESRGAFLASTLTLHSCANRKRTSAAVLGSFHPIKRVPRALALLSCLLAFSAAGEESKVVIGALHWDGTLALTFRELEGRMISSAASWKPWATNPTFDELVLQEDLERVAGLYRASGYYDAEVEYVLKWEEARRRVDVFLTVVEGEPVLLTKRAIEFEGSEFSPEQTVDLLADLPLAEGEIFSTFAYGEAKETLLLRLANLGYPAAAFSGGAEVDVASQNASLHWRVDAGPRIGIGEVTISGTKDVDSELVSRELLFAEGDVYSREAIVESERAVYATGLFRRVAVMSRDPGDGNTIWPIEIEVEEREAQTVKLGVGYGTEDKFRARATWTHRNFLGKARMLSATGKYSSLVLGAGLRMVQPRFPDRETETSIDFAGLRETPPAYDSDLVTAGLHFERPLSERWTAFASYRFEWGDVSNKTIESTRIEGETLLSFFRFAIQHNALDDLAKPRRGTWFEVSAEPSFRFIGSDVNYIRLRGEGRWFHPVWRATLATRVRLGTLQPFSGSQGDDIPVFKLFYSGGSNSVRGFRYQHLGPLDAQGEPEGGLTLAEANVELRFPIWRSLSGVAFLDSGQIAAAPFKLRFGAFLYSTGGGLRVRTPIGDLRIDYGHLLNRPAGVNSGRFYLSIGHAF